MENRGYKLCDNLVRGGVIAHTTLLSVTRKESRESEHTGQGRITKVATCQV